MPKVSICVPAYGDVHGIHRLLNSIRTQTFTDYEIIIADDTRDSSVTDAVNEYKELNIRYIYNENPLGACGNWNKTLDEAKGEYIKIMHQDDFFTFEDSLERLVNMLEDMPGAILAFCGSRQVNIDPKNPYSINNYEDRCISDENLENLRSDYRDLYNGDWIGAPSAVIYRNCPVRFDPALTWIIDVDFYMALLKDKNEFVCSREPLISIGVGEEQLTNRCIDDGDLNIREYRHVMAKYDLSGFPEYRKRLCYIAVIYKKGYSAIRDMGIPKAEYVKELRERREYLRDFYIKLIKRKLINR